MKNLPDLRLLHAFGNEDVLLEKVAGGEALAARVAIGLMEANRSLDTRRREELLSAQAERMNHAFRMIEDQKMLPVRAGAQHTRMPMILMALQAQHGGDSGMGLGRPLQGVPRQLMGEDVPLGMDEGMVRMASAIGQDLAGHALEKDAGIGAVIGNLGKSLKPAVAGLGKGLSSAGKGVSSALQGAGKGVQGFLGNAKGKLQGALGGGAAKNPFLSPPKPAHNPFNSAAQSAASTRATNVASNAAAGKVLPPSTPATPAAPVGGKVDPTRVVKQSPVAATQSGNRATQQVQPAGGKVQPAAQPPAAPSGEEGGGFDLQKAWDRTGLSDGKWKYKLPMLAAGAAGLYGLHAGAKKGLEMLGREPHAAQYNQGGAIPAYGVNQYGVPDRSTPFM